MLFNIYTRHVPTIASPSLPMQLADDIALTLSHPDCHEVSRVLPKSTTEIANHFQERNLILNNSKSHVLQISGQDITVKCRGNPLPVVTQAEYLVITIDEDVQFDEHVNNAVKKVSQKVGALWRARPCLTRRSREQYVKSVVMPDLLYGSVAFSGCLRQDQRSRLQVQQNRAARAVFGLPPRTKAPTSACSSAAGWHRRAPQAKDPCYDLALLELSGKQCTTSPSGASKYSHNARATQLGPSSPQICLQSRPRPSNRWRDHFYGTPCHPTCVVLPNATSSNKPASRSVLLAVASTTEHYRNL